MVDEICDIRRSAAHSFIGRAQKYVTGFANVSGNCACGGRYPSTTNIATGLGSVNNYSPDRVESYGLWDKARDAVLGGSPTQGVQRSIHEP